MRPRVSKGYSMKRTRSLKSHLESLRSAKRKGGEVIEVSRSNKNGTLGATGLFLSTAGGKPVTRTSTEYPRVLPQPEPLAAPDPVFHRAAEIVRERGFCQGPWRVGGPVCAAGAVGQAGEELGFSRPEMEARLLQFADALGGSVFEDVHSWNDAPGRTAGEVAEALDRAAYGL
jgi:hypothetical protein